MIKQFAAATALMAAALNTAHAGFIVSAQSAEILSGQPGEGAISSTHNQYGLLSPYESGVQDFDDYIASAPLHGYELVLKNGSASYHTEWFTNAGVSTAVVSYDLGSVQQTIGMALWNEDANGSGRLNILSSLDGQNWVSLLSNLTSTDHAYKSDYSADVFSWASTPTRYIKLEMSMCPTSEIGRISCSIGEVAFNVTAVPEPSSVATLSLGLLLLGAVAARHRRN